MARSQTGRDAAPLSKAAKPASVELSVAAVLADWDDERLARLLTWRPDLASPPPRDLTELAARASSWPSVQACFASLDLGCCQLTEALCLLEQPTTTRQLAGLLGEPVAAEDMEGPLARLEERALLLRRDDHVQLLPVLAQLRYPAGLGPPAEALLRSQPVTSLVAMAERLGIPARPLQDRSSKGEGAHEGSAKARAAKARASKARASKAETLAVITEALSDPNLIERLIGKAPAQAGDLARQLAVGPPVTYSPYGNYNLGDRTTLGWLANRALLVPLSWDTLVMPREVGLSLRGGRPFPGLQLSPPDVVVSPIGPEAVERAAADQALRLVSDVTTILDEWGDTPPKLLKAGGIGVREVRRAAKATGRSETDAARLIELAAVAGLCSAWSGPVPGRPARDQGRPGLPAGDQGPGVALPRAAYDEWLGRIVPDRWAVLVGAWLVAGLHLSLAGALGPDEKPIAPLLMRREPKAVPRRRVVLSALAQVSEGHCADPLSLVRRGWWDTPGQWAGGPALADQLIKWVRDEIELLGLGALGSLSRPGRLVAAGRLEEAAAALAGWAPAVTSEVLLQADLTAVASGELAAPLRHELALMADVESSGGATVYRFNEASLRRAFDAGRSAGDVMSFLEGHATKGVPQPLAYLVADLDRRHGRIRVGTATCYVRAEDPSLLAEVVRSRRTSRLHLRQLAPTVLVSEADPAAATETLRTAGYLPAREQPDGSLLLVRSEPLRAPDSSLPAELAGRKRPVPAPDHAAIVATLRRAPRPVPGSPAARNTAGSSPPGPRHGPLEQVPLGLPNGVEGPAGIPDDEVNVAAPMEDVLGMLARAGLLGAINDEVGSSGGDADQDDTGVPRPTGIARGPDAIEALLDRASDEEWLVRMAYTNRAGQTSQVTAAPVMVEAHEVMVECLPRWKSLVLALDRIVWARVLTPPEEECVL